MPLTVATPYVELNWAKRFFLKWDTGDTNKLLTGCPLKFKGFMSTLRLLRTGHFGTKNIPYNGVYIQDTIKCFEINEFSPS